MISLRKLTPNDVPGIVQLVRSAGFPARSEAGWRWALFGNPEQGDVPPGWAAERDGRLVAMIGLQGRDFRIDGCAIKAASGHTFISGPEGRGAGLSLARRALRTDGVAAAYSLNNNALAGRFHKKIGLEAWLGHSGRTRTEWPVHSATMLAGLAMSRIARGENGYALLSRTEWFRSGAHSLPHRRPHAPQLVRLDPSRAEHAMMIDDFGRATCRAHRASPVRSAKTYAYQMADPDAPGRVALIGQVSDGVLEGLMQLAVTKPNAFEPSEVEVIDLETRPGLDAARIVPALIREAKTLARHARLSRVRLPFSDRFEAVCLDGTGARFTRAHGHDPAHAAFRSGMESFRANWTPTGFEGDFFFALRMAPKRPGSRKNLLRKSEFNRASFKGQS